MAEAPGDAVFLRPPMASLPAMLTRTRTHPRFGKERDPTAAQGRPIVNRERDTSLDRIGP